MGDVEIDDEVGDQCWYDDEILDEIDYQEWNDVEIDDSVRDECWNDDKFVDYLDYRCFADNELQNELYYQY